MPHPDLHHLIRRKSAALFCFGWAAVMLSLTFAIQPVWNTFIHGWRVELVAALFLFATLMYGFWNYGNSPEQFEISRSEFKFLILPLIAFIVWSGISAMWADSWKSAVRYTSVWSLYLIFYLAVRRILDGRLGFFTAVKTPALALSFLAVLAVFSYISFLIFGGGSRVGIVYAKYGEQINTLFPLLVFAVLKLPERRFKFGVAILSLLWLLVFCSLSRINLILFVAASLTVGAIVFFVARFQKFRLRTAIIGAAIILAPLPLHIFSLLAENPSIPMVSRVSDKAAISSSNNFRKLMISISGEMIKTRPLTGIGADNFGFQANKYRIAYSRENAADLNLAEAENEIPERAHNEYLQIVAELGLVGGAIFVWLLAGIGLTAVQAFRTRRTLSPEPFAALIGIAIFLASSLVSSYSFRLVQNGFVFFFVLAVAAKKVFDTKDRSELREKFTPSATQLRFGFAFGMLACLSLAAYSIVRVSSAAYATNANYVQNLDESILQYQTAIRLDDENPDARIFLGRRLIEAGQYAAAVPFLQAAIRIGAATSADFSYLATAQTLAGDDAGAERTFAEAAEMYPQSAFVLTRYAALLKRSGKVGESNIQFERARRINAGAANTWWTIINDGALAATNMALKRGDYLPVMDLRPEAALYAVLTERYINFPEEKMKFDF